MKIKAIIADLDNTIYPVSSIGNKLFAGLFRLIETSGEYKGDPGLIREQIMRRPFQDVAGEYNFSENLYKKCIELLSVLTYDDPIQAFEGYQAFREIECVKYLVTKGLQICN